MQIGQIMTGTIERGWCWNAVRVRSDVDNDILAIRCDIIDQHGSKLPRGMRVNFTVGLYTTGRYVDTISSRTVTIN